jgi:surface antigen
MTGRFPNWGGNAGYWDTNAAATGWKVEAVPFADSIVVMQPTATNAAGHVGWVADTRVKSGVLQVKVYDRNSNFKCINRDGVWLNVASSMRFIVVPPRRETVLH